MAPVRLSLTTKISPDIFVVMEKNGLVTRLNAPGIELHSTAKLVNQKFIINIICAVFYKPALLIS
jgi:hypothetical protein